MKICDRTLMLPGSTTTHENGIYKATGAITRPGIKQQEEQPHECDQCELVEKQVRHHGDAPSPQCEIGAFYLAVGARQLSAAAWYTTPFCSCEGRQVSLW